MNKLIVFLFILSPLFLNSAKSSVQNENNAKYFQSFSCTAYQFKIIQLTENMKTRIHAWWDGYCSGYIDSLLDSHLDNLQENYGESCKNKYYAYYNFENMSLDQHTINFLNFIKTNKSTWNLKISEAFDDFMNA